MRGLSFLAYVLPIVMIIAYAKMDLAYGTG